MEEWTVKMGALAKMAKLVYLIKEATIIKNWKPFTNFLLKIN